MKKLSSIDGTKLAIAKHRARLRAVDILHSAYFEAHSRYGMTKADFARRIDMKPSQLSRIFSGSQNVTVETVEAALRAFEARLVVGFEFLDDVEVSKSNRYPRPEYVGPTETFTTIPSFSPKSTAKYKTAIENVG